MEIRRAQSPAIASLALGVGAVLAGAAWISSPVVTVEPSATVAEALPTAYIVASSSTMIAKSAVLEVGGNVTGELGLIDSVSATLTSAQAESLRKRGAVRSVFPDASVEVASVPVSGGATTSTVADNFDVISYANNNGSHRWASNWTEGGDDGQPLTGKVSIAPNLLPGLVSAGRLSLTGNGSFVSRRAAIAPGARNATLRFDVSRVALEANDYVSVQASRDGYTYTEVGRIVGPANDSRSSKVAFDISRFASADLSIRLTSRMTSSLLDRDAVQIDNVELGYDSVYATGVSYPSLAGADKLHAQGITGLLVTVAVLDTGYWHHPDTDFTSLGLGRVLAQYDAVSGQMDATQLALLGLTSLGAPNNTDASGHGSHLSSIVLNTQKTLDGKFFGVAPDANLVSVRAFDTQGRGTYSSVIRGIDWVVRNRDAYRIRVLNLSLGATPQSRYWDDPLNRAVMRAWQAGIVVVASAGNTGPAPQTITVPGNVPYVITVGAMTDAYTPTNPTDDRLTSFSAAGPTFEGFVKPEVVAPGGHIWSLMPTYAHIAQSHPEYQNSGDYFTMSGTSQAAAVTSGVVALLLQAQPGLTPDQVKCKLMSSAKPARDQDGNAAYSVFQQGSGLIDASAARASNNLTCANRGLDIEADLAGTRHYGGPARQSDNGDYYVADAEGYGWNQGYSWNQGYAWNQGYSWNQNSTTSEGYSGNQGYSWNQGYAWNQSAYDWQEEEPWASESTPASTAPMSINAWVDQE